MSVVPKPNCMRIIALPLARVRAPQNPKLNSFDYNPNALLVFYHFDLVSPCAGREDPPWHKKVLEVVTDKAANVWTSLAKAPKGSWKLWTYQLGERVADKIEFEELALRNVDPSLGPAIPTSTSTEPIDSGKNDLGQSHPLSKIPLIFPPSLYPAGVEHALIHLRTLLTDRAPRHRRGFYLWMLIAPLTIPIILIPLIPNFPLFFCVWRSWSHYRAYRSSQYLSFLLDRGLIEPDPSSDLDELYASFTSSSRTFQSLPPPNPEKRSSETSNVAVDRVSEAASGTVSSRSERIFLCREAVPTILEMFRLPAGTTIDIHRAMNQAHARLEKSS